MVLVLEWHHSIVEVATVTKPVLKPMQVRIPDSIRNWLKTQARAEDRSVNYVLNRLLERAQKEASHA